MTRLIPTSAILWGLIILLGPCGDVYAQARTIDPSVLDRLRREDSEENDEANSAIAEVAVPDATETPAPGDVPADPAATPSAIDDVLTPTLGVREAAEGQAADAANGSNWGFSSTDPSLVESLDDLRGVEEQTEKIVETAEDEVSQAIGESSAAPNVPPQPPYGDLPRVLPDLVGDSIDQWETVQEAQGIRNLLPPVDPQAGGSATTEVPGEQLLNNLKQAWDNAPPYDPLVDAPRSTPTLGEVQRELEEFRSFVGRMNDVEARITYHNYNQPVPPAVVYSQEEYDAWVAIFEQFNAEAYALNDEKRNLFREIGIELPPEWDHQNATNFSLPLQYSDPNAPLDPLPILN